MEVIRLLEHAKELQREYQRKWRTKNREKLRASHKAWRDANPEKIQQYRQNYWIKKAKEQLEAEKHSNRSSQEMWRD